VVDGANGKPIAARVELRGGGAELASVVADHGGGERRPVALGAHDDAFHGALRSGGDLTGERRRLSVRGKDRQTRRHHAGGPSKQQTSAWDPRLLNVSSLSANSERKRLVRKPRRAHLRLQAHGPASPIRRAPPSRRSRP